MKTRRCNSSCDSYRDSKKCSYLGGNIPVRYNGKCKHGLQDAIPRSLEVSATTPSAESPAQRHERLGEMTDGVIGCNCAGQSDKLPDFGGMRGEL